MPKWLRKTLITLITVCTFGLVTPPDYLLIDEIKAEKTSKGGYSHPGSLQPPAFNAKPLESMEVDCTADSFLDSAIEQAEQQALKKFGAKITPVIEKEFKDIVLPKIEDVLIDLSARLPERELKHLQISEKPAGGYGEKIFHVYNRETGQDILRFHVRRDHPPQDGYWFNFHYHTMEDDFQQHHHLANIYWDANIPPKWLN